MLQDQVTPKKMVTDEYTIKSKLGNGKTSVVYLCQDKQNKQYAMKMYKDIYSTFKDRVTESNVLRELDHPNIVKIINFEMKHIILEYLQNGELFDYIQQANKQFPQDLARYYFIQIVDALCYMQEKNMYHRDIKLENLLLDDEFNIKLCDLGFAVICKQDEKVDRILGTEGYMSPELVRQEKYYSPEKSDVFALGVTMFSLVNGFPPFFKQASKMDPYYKFFVENKTDLYFLNLKRKFGLEFQQEFIDLTCGMLDSNPETRFTFQQVRQHPWLQGEVASKEKRIQYMSELKAKIQSE